MGEPPTSTIRRPFDAIADDENRRDEILKKLTKALEGYFGSCSREREVQWDRVDELLGAACRGFYDSLATSYLAVEPPVDPQHLFEISGVLYGGSTIVDFEKAATELKIRRPGHWPPPRMWREDDSLEEVRVFTELSKAMHQDIRLGPHLEGGWLNEWVSEGVKHWKPRFERQFAADAKAAARGDESGKASDKLTDFLGKVSENDPNYSQWIAHNAGIRETDHRSKAQAIRDADQGHSPNPEILGDMVAKLFDSGATAALATVVDAQTAANYCHDLDAHAADCIRLVKESKVWERTGFAGNEEQFLGGLQRRLSARLDDAKADAWSIVRKAAEVKGTSAVPETDRAPMRAGDGATPESGATSPRNRIPRLFRKDGESWRLVFEGREVHVNNRKGLGYIADLLRSPDKSFHCLELLAAQRGERHTPALGSAGKALDPVAFENYRLRVEDLEDRLAQAERNQDQGQKELLQAELEQLTGELQRATGLGGRHREAHDDAERIRKGVSNAITRGIQVIRDHHPALADHLKLHIKLGAFVSYKPDDTPWQF